MKPWMVWISSLLGICLCSRVVQAQPIPIETFAAGAAISDASLSADGRYLALVSMRQGRRTVLVQDLKADKPRFQPVLVDVPGKFDIRWCKFVADTRLVCSYYGNINDAGLLYTVTRLVAVDVDGQHQLVLLQGSTSAGGQFQDQVVDWNPGKPDTILIAADESTLSAWERADINAGADFYGSTSSHGYPALFELNVNTGKTKLVLHSREPILYYLSDFHGQARVGYGYASGTTSYQYFVRSPDNGSWSHLLKFEAFDGSEHLLPEAVDAKDPSHAYAIGRQQGRDALWSIDLSDKQPPQLLFGNDSVDIDGPVLLKNGELLGVSYETDRPHMYYASSRLGGVLRQLDSAVSGTANSIIDCAADESLCVIQSRSDVEPGAWYLLDTRNFRLYPIGRTNPTLDSTLLAHLQPISYPARDGTMIPGYLMTPPGAKAEHLPLIIMPHGGPIARDRWRYFFLQQFLVNRGYAVLQMNFRGSGGFGEAWYRAAHQDWGGLTYSDIIDGARWAVDSGLADPQRMAIVGWSFGGYAALLAATRDSDLFRCAVSIAGISDLSLMLSDATNFTNSAIERAQVGSNAEKLKADSPRRHVDTTRVPLLMVHGDKDVNVDVDQSRAMARAMRSGGRSFEYLELKGSDHYIESPTDRAAMLAAVERFLKIHLGAGESLTPDH